MAKGERPKTVTNYAAYGRDVAEAIKKGVSPNDLYNKALNDGMNVDYRKIQNMDQLVKFLDGQSVLKVIYDASHKFSPQIHDPKSVYNVMPRLTKDGGISVPIGQSANDSRISYAGLRMIHEDARINIKGDLSVKSTARGTKYTLPTGFSFVFVDDNIKEAKNRKKK